MKTVLAFILPLAFLVGSASGGTQQARTNAVAPDSVSADRVAFYDVALTCPSAPKLGCGSRAKRVFATLTADERVAAVWVPSAGSSIREHQ